MARKEGLLILRKVLKLIHKLRKPIIPNLKKLRKRKELKLLTRFHGEYQFSPSTTPLILRRNQFKNRAQRDLCSFFHLYSCFGNLKKVQGTETLPVPVPAIEIEDLFEEFGSGNDGSSESVDEKAERFIQRFYQEMRMQRQESI